MSVKNKVYRFLFLVDQSDSQTNYQQSVRYSVLHVGDDKKMMVSCSRKSVSLPFPKEFKGRYWKGSILWGRLMDCHPNGPISFSVVPLPLVHYLPSFPPVETMTCH